MKDYDREVYEEGRPEASPKQALRFCLEQLFKDKEHVAQDVVAGCCTYEELIGALLVTQDMFYPELTDEV